MRNRNVKFSESEDKPSRVRGVNPFDTLSRYEYVELVCSTCKKRIQEINHMEVEWVTGNNGQCFDRVHFYRQSDLEILQKALNAHACMRMNYEKRISEDELMSGRIQARQEADALLEIMDNQTFPDEIEIKPAPVSDELKQLREDVDKLLAEKPEDIFKVGMWVMNTDNGHTYRLDGPSILQIVVEHYKTGKRNIVPYT